MILLDLEAALREPDPPTVEEPPTFQPHLAASKIFAEVRPLQMRLAGIANAAELLRQISEVVEVLPPLAAFQTKIKDLAQLLEPMRNFRNRLRNVAPFEVLEHELVQFSAAFGASLTQLAASLDAAVIVQNRLAHLAAEFEPARTLSDEFSALARSFKRNAQEPAGLDLIDGTENGLEEPIPSQIASKVN